MEQALFAQVVIICQKESESKTKKKNTKKYNFQEKSTSSRRWFNIDHEWLEEYFMTREPDFYLKLSKYI